MTENKSLRAYTVVRVTASGLKVIEASQEARNQEHACDLVTGELPPAERNGTFGAFLASSYREIDYSSEQTVVTSKRRHEQPTFGIIRAASVEAA